MGGIPDKRAACTQKHPVRSKEPSRQQVPGQGSAEAAGAPRSTPGPPHTGSLGPAERPGTSPPPHTGSPETVPMEIQTDARAAQAQRLSENSHGLLGEMECGPECLMLVCRVGKFRKASRSNQTDVSSR